MVGFFSLIAKMSQFSREKKNLVDTDAASSACHFCTNYMDLLREENFTLSKPVT